MAKDICVCGIAGEDAALPGGAGDDVVEGTPASVVVLQGLDHHSVGHLVMGIVVVKIARVVALLKVGQDLPESLPAVILVGIVVDDDHVEVGLLVPAAGGPGAEEDDGRHIGLGNQLQADIKSGRVGIRMDRGWHFVSDAVSSRRRHGDASGWRWGRRRACRWMKGTVMGGSSETGFRTRFAWVKDARQT